MTPEMFSFNLWLILAAILVFLLVGVYSWYIKIIVRRNKVLEALASIDAQLTKRSNIIPNILEIAKRFMGHETQIFNEITSLRTRAIQNYNAKDQNQLQDHLQSASDLSARMGQLILQAEAYPTLKSDQTMIETQQAYQNVEEEIAAARRFYNTTVAQFNTSIQIFPGNLLALSMGLKQMPYYAASDEEKRKISAKEYL